MLWYQFDRSFSMLKFIISPLLPHASTFFTLSSNIQLGGSPAPPLVFTAAAAGVAPGGELSGLPRFS